jgi:hypothetical protein
MLPGLGNSACVGGGYDVRRSFLDDAEAVEFELADDGGFAGTGRAGNDESFHFLIVQCSWDGGESYLPQSTYLWSSGVSFGRIVRAMISEPFEVG